MTGRAPATKASSLPWVPIAVLGGALLLTLAAVGPLWLAALLWPCLVWFCAAGVAVARRLYRGDGALGAALLVGPVWGFAWGTLALLAMWTAGLRHWSILLLAPPVVYVVCRLLFHRLTAALQAPTYTRADAGAVALVLLVVPLIVAVPYARVGETGPDGRAYRAYFTADFVWVMAVTAEVSKGDVPPRNPFLIGEPLRYYWPAHLVSSVQYNHLQHRTRLEPLLLMNAVGLGLVFVAALYAFTRQFTSSAALAAAGCIAAVLFTSFEGLERLATYWREGAPIASVRTLNIDAVTRWFYGALPIDGLHRLLLYQPQHHAVAYATGVSALLVLRQATRLTSLLMVFVGLLLGATVIISSFAALMLTTMAAGYVAVRVVRARAWVQAVPWAVAAAIPLAAAAAVVVALQIVDRRGGPLLELTVNELALARPLVSLPLSLGPMLVTTLAGAWLAWRRRDGGLLPPLIVVGVSAAFAVFVNVLDHQDVYVGFRSGHFFFMAAAPLTAVMLGAVWQAPGRARRLGLALAAVLALAATPTLAIDLYNAQDTSNRSMGPGFRWTLVLPHAELEALEWIRRETPPSAIVQISPPHRDPETWSYIPTFAQRRMAGGIPISMVPLEPYYVASRRMRLIYGAPTAQDAFGVAARNNINFLVVGSPERAAYPEVEAMLDAAPQLFPLVFRNGAVSIYQPLPFGAATP